MALNQAQLVNPPVGTRPGGVKAGAGITISADGTISSSSSLPAATLAQAAAGTITTSYSSPQTAVPKSSSGMTGAALIPGGNDAARPSPAVTGMMRYNNTDSPASMEFYDGSSWNSVGGQPLGSLATWTHGIIPSIPAVARIAYGNGKWLAIGQTQQSAANVLYATSTDGLTWSGASTLYSGPSNSTIGALAFVNGRFITWVNGPNLFYYSTDGVSWNTGSGNVPGSVAQGGNIIYGNGVYLATGGSTISRSTDGVNWTSVNVSSIIGTGTGEAGYVAYGNGIFLFLAARDTTGLSNFSVNPYRSADGVNWTRGPDTGSWSSSNGATEGMVFNGTNFIYTVRQGGIYVTADGVTVKNIVAPDSTGSTSASGTLLYDGPRTWYFDNAGLAANGEGGPVFSDTTSNFDVAVGGDKYTKFTTVSSTATDGNKIMALDTWRTTSTTNYLAFGPAGNRYRIASIL